MVYLYVFVKGEGGKKEGKSGAMVPKPAERRLLDLGFGEFMGHDGIFEPAGVDGRAASQSI